MLIPPGPPEDAAQTAHFRNRAATINDPAVPDFMMTLLMGAHVVIHIKHAIYLIFQGQ